MNHKPDRELVDLPRFARVSLSRRPVVPAFTTCQWIEGEPRARVFCGAPSVQGKSYCLEHAKRCFLKVVDLEKEFAGESS